MPRYKVKAFDGKTLTIDAVDEAALDEAMQEYEGQAKPQEAPAPSALDRAGQGALAGAVPGYSTYKTATQGESGTDIASAAAGDVANLAMLGIGGPAKLASSTALGGAIGAAGGALQPVAQGMGRAVGDVAAKMSPLSYIPPQASDSAWNPLNLLREVPRTLGETVGELAPQAALLALTGRLAKGAAKGPAPLPEAGPTPQQLRALELQKAGYPVTASHGIPGDVRLKQAMNMPELAGEAAKYQEALGEAQRADIGRALGVGAETTQTLGEAAKGSFEAAKAARENSYRSMLRQAEGPATGEVTGLGQITHAGKKYAQNIFSDLASKGLEVTPALKEKALIGEGLSSYDVPVGINPADATTLIKFADLASQKASSAVQLDALARDFAKTEKLFREGGASAGSFKRQAQNAATDLAAEIIKKRDEAGGPSAKDYPAWAAQKANWAKSADLVDEFKGKMSSPKTRLTGEKMYSSSELSPEQIFTKEFQNASVSKIEAFKSFLKDNGESPAILESMAKDWLNDVGNKPATPAAGVSAIERAWKGLSTEKKNALFSPETIDSVEGAFKRAKEARTPLEVLGTNAEGGSQTAAKSALDRILRTSPISGNEAKGAAIGGVIGASTMGPAGAAALGAVGGVLGNKLDAAKRANLVAENRALLTGEAPIISAPQAPGRMRTVQAAIAPAAASLAKRGNNAMANAALATTRAQQDNRLRPRFIQALNQ